MNVPGFKTDREAVKESGPGSKTRGCRDTASSAPWRGASSFGVTTYLELNVLPEDGPRTLLPYFGTRQILRHFRFETAATGGTY